MAVLEGEGAMPTPQSEVCSPYTKFLLSVLGIQEKVSDYQIFSDGWKASYYVE